MTGDDWLFMEYFIKRIRITKDTTMLLSLESHQPHLLIKVLYLSKENGVILPFPPHLTNRNHYKFQFTDLKKFVNINCNA